MLDVVQGFPRYFVIVIIIVISTVISLFPLSLDPKAVAAFVINGLPFMLWTLFVIVVVIWCITSVVVSVVLKTRGFAKIINIINFYFSLMAFDLASRMVAYLSAGGLPCLFMVDIPNVEHTNNPKKRIPINLLIKFN